MRIIADMKKLAVERAKENLKSKIPFGLGDVFTPDATREGVQVMDFESMLATDNVIDKKAERYRIRRYVRSQRTKWFKWTYRLSPLFLPFSVMMFSDSFVTAWVWYFIALAAVRIDTERRVRRIASGRDAEVVTSQSDVVVNVDTSIDFLHVINVSLYEAWYAATGQLDFNYVDERTGHVHRGSVEALKNNSEIERARGFQYPTDSKGKFASKDEIDIELVREYAVLQIRIGSTLTKLRDQFADTLTSLLNSRLPRNDLVTWHVEWIRNTTEGYLIPIVEPKIRKLFKLTAQKWAKTCDYPVIHAGLGFDDKIVDVNFWEEAHELLAGTTGGGKSNFLNTVIVQLLNARKTHDLKIYMIDMKMGIEFGIYAPFVERVVSDYQGYGEVVTEFKRIMNERNAELARIGKRKWNDAGSPMKGEYFLIMDEIAQVLDVGLMGTRSPLGKEVAQILEKAQQDIQDILSLGRSAGVHIIAATQKPDSAIISTRMRDQFNWRVSARLNTAAASDIVLGDSMPHAANLPNVKGRMVVRKGGEEPEIFQSPYLSTEILDEYLEIIKH